MDSYYNKSRKNVLMNIIIILIERPFYDLM